VGVRFCACLYLCVCTLARTGERGTVTTEMDVLASSEGSQLVWVRKLVLASARSGGSLHLCSLGAQLEGVGEVWGFLPPPTSGFKGDPPTATTQSQWSLHWEQKSIELSTAVSHSRVSVPLLSLPSPHPSFLCPHFLYLSYSILFSSADGVCVPKMLSLNWLYLICPQCTVMPWCICFLFRGI